jgi:hypothetical protein
VTTLFEGIDDDQQGGGDDEEGGGEAGGEDKAKALERRSEARGERIASGTPPEPIEVGLYNCP